MTDNTREGVQADPDVQLVKGGPSEAAVEATAHALAVARGVPHEDGVPLAGAYDPKFWPWLARQSLAAAHDSALGLDRSVRLGDVVDYLNSGEFRGAHLANRFAAAIHREFGATTHAE